MPADASYRTVLTCAGQGLGQEAMEITPGGLGLPGDVPWSVTKRTLRGGKQQGVGLITIDNGNMQIDLIETRGLGVLEVRRGELRLGWDSPVKEVVHPQWVDLASRGGLGWLEGFNELVARCGLEYAGGPGRDKFITNRGVESECDLTLHGRIANLPASHVEVVIDRDPPHRICVRGVVHERQLYGPKLELAVEVSTAPGSDTFQIADVVTNRGGEAQEFELIYHCNFGAPLLEAGAKFHLAAKSVTAIDSRAAEDLDAYAVYLPPTPGYTEQVYLLEPLADAHGATVALLEDARGERGASIRWSTSQLPYFALWKSTCAEADGYVTGLEPGTCFPFNRMIERQAGRLPTLQPGEAREFVLQFALHDTAAVVAAVRREVESIQAGHELRLVAESPRGG